MMDLTIREIAQACGGKLVVQGGGADGDTCVGSVVIDSRAVEPGGVFIATVGERVDGHSFIAAAFAKGAALAVTQKRPEEVREAESDGAAVAGQQPGSSVEKWGNYVLVEDTLQALKDIAEAYRKKISVKIIGITGSVGKTSTKEFIAAVLAEKYRVLKTEGNFNNEIGVPLTLLRIRGEHELAVVEMGISDFGEMHRLSKMARPDVCVMTNIGQSHLNNLKDRDGILRAKSEIFDYMAVDGEICLNGEDDKLNALTEIKGHKPHFFGLESSPSQEVAAVDIVSRGLWGSDATLLMAPTRSDQDCAGTNAASNAASPQAGWPGYRRLAVHVPQPGRHMVLNAAAAACVAGLFGLSDDQIAAGIGKVASVSGRTHIISHPRHTIIDDCYNANPASVRAALDLLALADTRKVAILGDMLNLGENSHGYHAGIGSYAVEAGIDCIYCVGEESRYMYQAALDAKKTCASSIAPGATDREGHPSGRPGGSDHALQSSCRILHYPDRGALLEAIAADAAHLIPEGSTILVKASHDCGFAEILAFLQDMDGPAVKH